MLFMSYFFSYLSGVLEKNECVPLKYSRKLFNSIGKCSLGGDGNVIAMVIIKKSVFFAGHWIPMCALIALGYITKDDKNLAILLLVIAIGINAATYLGFQVGHLRFTLSRIALNAMHACFRR